MDHTALAGPGPGRAGATGRPLSGYQGIFRQLAREQGETFRMLCRLASSHEGSEVRGALFPLLRGELLAQGRAAEQELYAPLREHAQTAELVRRGRERHGRVEELVERLRVEGCHAASWTGLVRDLAELYGDHVRAEQDELYPAARDALTADEADRMSSRYLRARHDHVERLDDPAHPPRSR